MNKSLFLFLLFFTELFCFDYNYIVKSILYKDNSLEKINSKNIKLNQNLKLYDATSYKSKKLKNEKIFPKMNLIYQRKLWKDWDNIISRETIDLLKIEETAKSLKFSEIPYIIDIEHWNVHTMDKKIANENIDKYIEVIKLFKKIRPDLKFGFYGVLPNRDYWSPISNDPKKINEWNIINNRLKRLAKYVDVVCPSLYTFYNNIEDWNIYARENINRAKEYNKPIYGFIWPQFHRSNKIIGGDYLNDEFWSNQLNVLKDIDAIVIWGGWDSSKKGKDRNLIWNEEKNWWKITKEFIISNNLN